VAEFVSVTVAPGGRRRTESVIVPLTVASVDCAAVMAGASAAPNEMKTAKPLSNAT
jgi:hypothetical protein